MCCTAKPNPTRVRWIFRKIASQTYLSKTPNNREFIIKWFPVTLERSLETVAALGTKCTTRHPIGPAPRSQVPLFRGLGSLLSLFSAQAQTCLPPDCRPALGGGAAARGYLSTWPKEGFHVSSKEFKFKEREKEIEHDSPLPTQPRINQAGMKLQPSHSLLKPLKSRPKEYGLCYFSKSQVCKCKKIDSTC